MTNYLAPRPLASSDRFNEFECRSSEQTTWLRHHARQSASSGSTKVLVVTKPGSREVVAYYAWCMAQLDFKLAPARLRKGAGRYPQPLALLARLGVHASHEGQGLGAGMLKDAILRLVDLGEEIGCRGLLIHAESTEARSFYEHLIPELMASPSDGLHLILMMKDARKSLLS